MLKPTAPLTPDEFRKQLMDNGTTLRQWAEDRGYREDYCSKVLIGAVKGVRGKGHQIAVDMGIKAKPAQTTVGCVPRTNPIVPSKQEA